MTNLRKKKENLKSKMLIREDVLNDLRDELAVVIECFWETIEGLKDHLSIRSKYQAQCFAVSNIATFFSQNFDRYFPNQIIDNSLGDSKFSLKKYDFWFKKANQRNMPAFNKTKRSNSLINLEYMPMLEGFYECIVEQYEPSSLLFMTYQIDELGQINTPLFSLINGSVVEWSISEEDLFITKNKIENIQAGEEDIKLELKDDLKKKKDQKKQS